MSLLKNDTYQDYYNNSLAPLAERMRPKSLDDYIGKSQDIIKNLLQKESLFSVIIWGPPGCGKTTLARLIAKHTEVHMIEISAINSSVKDLREIIKNASIKYNLSEKTILFIDEIHRFNRSQQDSLLHAVETGIITLIGATTENPSFEVNTALLSRCRVLSIPPLSTLEMELLLEKAIHKDEQIKQYLNLLSQKEKSIIIEAASGDGRKMFNILETLIEVIKKNGEKNISESLRQTIQISSFNRYDKKGEYHYDVISAFIKSIRGSDPDAAIYYLARLLDGGEEPRFIARRLIILASEDIGNASPNSLVIAQSTFDAVHTIGMPEARIILAQTTIYLALQPKSNASYLAINKALEIVKKEKEHPIPLHLRNAPTKLMSQLGYGKEYLYPHNFPHNFTKQNYFPQDLKTTTFYEPTDNGKEKTMREIIFQLWNRK